MGLFSSDGPVDSHGCPLYEGEQTIFEHGTGYHALYYTTIAATAITAVLSLSLIFMHLRRYRVPKEQRQIIKIVFTPLAFALVAFGCLQDYHAAQYVSELGDWYSAMAFTTLFLLFIQFAVPDSEFGEGMFEAMHKVAQKEMQGGASSWPKMSWILVFQYPVTVTIAILILEGTIATDTYCPTSFKPKFGHLWFMIFKTLGLVLCFITVLRFYRKIKSILKTRRGASKLFVFKGIVGVRFIQTWIFNILLERKVLKASKHFSLGDYAYGLPATILAVEMVLFSAGFWYAYSSTEYSTKARPGYEHINFFKALLDSMNPLDTIKGVLRIPALLIGRAGAGKYTGPSNYGPVGGQGYHQPSYSLDSNDGGRMQYGYGQTPHQPPPPFHARDEEEMDGKRHLMADARGARTPSPRPY